METDYASVQVVRLVLVLGLASKFLETGFMALFALWLVDFMAFLLALWLVLLLCLEAVLSGCHRGDRQV